MLRLDPTERITISAALAHPYFNQIRKEYTELFT